MRGTLQKNNPALQSSSFDSMVQILENYLSKKSFLVGKEFSFICEGAVTGLVITIRETGYSRKYNLPLERVLPNSCNALLTKIFGKYM